jgi:hypothetical protein
MSRAKKSDPAAKAILETVLTAARAGDVLDHREIIGAPLTRRAAELLVGKLAEAPDPNAAADMMISRGWRGFDVKWGGPPQRQGAIASQPQPTFNDLADFYDAQSQREGTDSAGTGSLFQDVPKLTHH